MSDWIPTQKAALMLRMEPQRFYEITSATRAVRKRDARNEGIRGALWSKSDVELLSHVKRGAHITWPAAARVVEAIHEGRVKLAPVR